MTGHDVHKLAKRVRDQFGWETVVLDGAVRVEVPDAHTQVARIVEAFPGEVQTVTAGRPTLEDVFIRLTGERFAAGELLQTGGKQQ
jgi:ABC-2 type transport system ATP-binding protein